MKTLEQLNERLRSEREVRIERMFGIIEESIQAFDHLRATKADSILYGTVAVEAMSRLIKEMDNIRLGEKAPAVIGNRSLQ